jgi:glycosyltransferase involved in cell wall biosynthesis
MRSPLTCGNGVVCVRKRASPAMACFYHLSEVTDSTPTLTVVIPCLDEADTITTQLRQLARETTPEPWEVIVADNGSTDGTRDIVRRLQETMSNLRLVDASGRRGVNHARNVGAAAARGEFILFCDADDEIRPGWLDAMCDALRSHDVVAGRIDAFSANEAWSVAARGVPQDSGLRGFGLDLPYASGANLGVRRSLHRQIGGFDEDFLGGADDLDYCLRLQVDAGADLHFEPRASVAYRYRHDLRSLFRQARFYGVGWVSLYRKHMHHGLPRQRHPWLLGVASWVGLLRRLPIPPSRRAAATFAWHFGWKLGLLEGSIRNRTVLLSVRGIV